MKREFRLTRSQDFKRVKDSGNSIVHPLLILVYSRNTQGRSRFAVVASKIIGNAVVRNFTKRRLKSCIAGLCDRINGFWDFIFYARKSIVNASYKEMCEAVEHLLNQANALGDKN